MNEKILVPVLGESITEATVAKWLKKEGDAVNADEPVVELETDKVNLEVPSPIEGILSEINFKDGDTVEVQPDFELIAFDFVSNPSTHGAFMRPVNEGVEKQKPESKIESIINSIMRG